MLLISVSGPSGSGKTTIVKLLNKLISEKRKTLIISTDQYYKSLPPSQKLLCINWDHIESIDVNLLYKDIKKIKKHKKVSIPSYDYVTHQRIDNAYTIDTDIEVIILEGIFALYDNRIRKLSDIKIYIDADPYKICFPRRFKRDATDRGRGGQSIVDQYFGDVLNGYHQFVEPMKKYADVIHVNEGDIPDENSTFIKMIINYSFTVLLK